MKVEKIFGLVLLIFVMVSCDPTENPSLQSRWRLIKVEHLDTPLGSPHRFTYFPEKPYDNGSPTFSFDADYNIWSWRDSLRIEYIIQYRGTEMSAHSATPYRLVGDTIQFTNSRYHFEIFDETLLLNGYGVSQHGRSDFTYYFELVE